MKNYIIILSILLISFFDVRDLKSQISTSDLGVSWAFDNYTPNGEQGYFENIMEAGDNYLACGYIMFAGRQLGYVMHFNEKGEKLKDWILTPPNDPEWTQSNSYGKGQAKIMRAYLTNGGDLITFAELYNAGADLSLKGTDINSTGSVYLNRSLRRGLWVSKVPYNYNYGDTPIVNRLDRGNSRISDGIVYDKVKGTYLMVGGDYPFFDSFLFRLYDENLNWLFDNKDSGAGLKNISWVASVSKGSSVPNEIVLTTGALGIHSYVFNPTLKTFTYSKVIANQLEVKDGKCVVAIQPDFTPILTYGPNTSWGFKADGSFWGFGRMGNGLKSQNPNVYQEYGYVYYMMKPLQTGQTTKDALVDCKVLDAQNQPVRHWVSAPYLMANSTTQYVGTFSYRGTAYMYLAEDKGTSFDLHIDPTTMPKMELSTTIKRASMRDGFLASGGGGGKPTLAKYSTCVNFRAAEGVNNVEDFVIDYSPVINLNKTIEHKGSKGTVTYKYKAVVLSGNVNGKSKGEVLEEEANFIPATSSTVLRTLNTSFNLSTEYAVVEYTFEMKDSYMAGGVAQSCGNTFSFKVISAPRTDVIAMPTFATQTDGTKKIKTKIKNNGVANFDAPFNITVYQDFLGNSIKYTYQYTKKIKKGETAHLEFDLPSQMNTATKYLLHFNDSGDGLISQMELDSDQATYEVKAAL